MIETIYEIRHEADRWVLAQREQGVLAEWKTRKAAEKGCGEYAKKTRPSRVVVRAKNGEYSPCRVYNVLKRRER